ncbi:methyltransferase [Paramicrobacterium fandaimingii]|uniref:methyltransferase n=1 Tax=Paramicrobacterium fandaimingii TaxID=2708079 RepID=UPI001423A3D8|nr:methyltransferase [Microbacterium fandaimingii]
MQPSDETAWQTLAPLIDLVTPMAVRVAATLGVADLLRDGPVSATDLARRSGADADALERMLRHLTFRGMFVESTPGVFALNPAAALLDSEHPSGMRVSLDLTGFGGQMDLAFTRLMHTVRTGEPAWQEVFGAPFWEYLEATPTMAASFDAVMAAGAEYVDDDAAAWDWSRARHVVDVGGGTGALVAALLQRHPQLQATLVDLPETVQRGRELLVARGLERRVRIAGQSFFDPLPPAGDVYVLNSILHDWPDSDAVAILRRCAEAAGPGGVVVIIEQNDGSGADHAEMDLRMLVLCAGRERTRAEFEALAREAGLSVTGYRSTPLGQVGIELRVAAAIDDRLPAPH